MHAFRRVQEQGRRSGAGKRPGQFAGDFAAFAHAGDDDPAPRVQKQANGLPPRPRRPVRRPDGPAPAPLRSAPAALPPAIRHVGFGFIGLIIQSSGAFLQVCAGMKENRMSVANLTGISRFRERSDHGQNDAFPAVLLAALLFFSVPRPRHSCADARSRPGRGDAEVPGRAWRLSKKGIRRRPSPTSGTRSGSSRTSRTRTMRWESSWERRARARTSLKEFQETVRLSPDNPDARYNLGLALDRAGQSTEAADTDAGCAQAAA